MTTFINYRNGIGGEIATTLLGVDISKLGTWTEFSETARAVCQTSEGFRRLMLQADMMFRLDDDDTDAVILATLFAMDYSGEAIKLADHRGVHFLGLMNHVGLSAREAVAACLFRLNR